MIWIIVKFQSVVQKIHEFEPWQNNKQAESENNQKSFYVNPWKQNLGEIICTKR